MNKQNSLNENRIADVSDNQLTLTPILNSTPAIKNRQSKIKNSSWWFNQMRRLVDNATDWEASPRPRPQQTWISNTYREALAPVTPKTKKVNEEKHLTE